MFFICSACPIPRLHHDLSECFVFCSACPYTSTGSCGSPSSCRSCRHTFSYSKRQQNTVLSVVPFTLRHPAALAVRGGQGRGAHSYFTLLAKLTLLCFTQLTQDKTCSAEGPRASSARPCALAAFLRPLRVLVTMGACSWS
jgi:hypothetical protein